MVQTALVSASHHGDQRPLSTIWIPVHNEEANVRALLAQLAAAVAKIDIFTPGIKARGFTTLVILLLLSTEMNAAFAGLPGEYIGRIYKNTREICIPIIERRIEPIGTERLATPPSAGGAS